MHRKCLASFEGEKINALVPKSWHNVTIKQLVSLDLKVASYKSMVNTWVQTTVEQLFMFDPLIFQLNVNMLGKKAQVS